MENHDQPKENQTDFYQILGVSAEASLDKITKKYRQLSKIYHPDKETGDLEKYLQINKAYKVLKNPAQRKTYDQSLSTTFNQMKDQERDTQYYVNQDFLALDQQSGKQVFDHEKFMTAFESSRTTHEDLIQENAEQESQRKQKSLDDLLADRDRDLSTFQQQQRTDLTQSVDPTTDQGHELFNQVFMKQHRRNTQLQEVDDQIIWGYQGENDFQSSFQPNDLTDENVKVQSINLMAQQNKTNSSQMGLFQKDYQALTSDTLNSLLSETQQEISQPDYQPSTNRQTRQPKMDLQTIKKKLMAYNRQTHEIEEQQKQNLDDEGQTFFQNNFKDDNKLTANDLTQETPLETDNQTVTTDTD